MAGLPTSSWRRSAISGLVLLLGLAWVAKTAYDLLLPIVPGLLVILGLVGMLGLLLRLRQR